VAAGETRVAAPCTLKKSSALVGELKPAAPSTSASMSPSEICSVKADRQ